MTSPAPRRGEAATREDAERVRLDKYGSSLDRFNVRLVCERIADYPEIQAAVLALPEVAELRRSERAAEALSIADRIDRSLMTRAEIVPWLRTWARVLAEEPPPALASSSATEPESAS